MTIIEGIPSGVPGAYWWLVDEDYPMQFLKDGESAKKAIEEYNVKLENGEIKLRFS